MLRASRVAFQILGTSRGATLRALPATSAVQATRHFGSLVSSRKNVPRTHRCAPFVQRRYSSAPGSDKDDTNVKPTSSGSGIAVAAPSAVATVPASRWVRMKAWVIKEAKHYWAGTKLLALETRISARLVSKMLGGTALTRRERHHLTRTAADMIRLIPFIVIVVVPFMDLLLPVLLFFNMLPSTFESKLQKEEKQLRAMKVKVEMAKFLQASIEEVMLTEKRESLDTTGLLKKIKSGDDISNEEIVMLASTLGDKFTLETASRPQLLSMCKYMGISHYGSNNWLMSQLEKKLEQIKADDEAIEAEGVTSLSLEELQAACAARGMRAHGVPKWQLERNLKRWLELSLEKHIAPGLLILSRAFLITARIAPEEAVKKTLATIDAEVLAAASAKDKPSVADKKIETLRKEDALVKAVAAKVSQEKKDEAAAVAMAPASVKAERVDGQPEKLDSLADAVDMLSRPGVAEERTIRALQTDSEKMQRAADDANVKSVLALRKLLQRLEKELVATNEKVAARLKMIDIDGDGIISEQELQTAATQLRTRLTPEEMGVLWEELEGSTSKAGVKVDQLVSALRRKAAHTEQVLERAAVDKVSERTKPTISTVSTPGAAPPANATTPGP